MLACVNCANPISLDPTAGRLPPWCPNCGASLKLVEPNLATVVTAPPANTPSLQAEEVGASPVETTVSTFESIAPDLEASQNAKVLRNGAAVCLLASGSLAYFTPMDAWLWSLVLAGIGSTMLLFWVRLRFQ